MTKSDSPRAPAPQPAAQRRPYKPPVLALYGSVRQVTFGSVGNRGDGAATKKTKVSDPLTKHDIARVGTHPLGIGLYLFRYRPDFAGSFGAGRQFGVMADEVERVLPAAVSRHASGFRAVDHGMLGIDDFGQRLRS